MLSLPKHPAVRRTLHVACGKRAVLREKVVIVATAIRVPRTAENHIRLISLLTAPRICAISSSTDKCSCRSFAKLSAWWLAPLAFCHKVVMLSLSKHLAVRRTLHVAFSFRYARSFVALLATAMLAHRTCGFAFFKGVAT